MVFAIFSTAAYLFLSSPALLTFIIGIIFGPRRPFQEIVSSRVHISDIRNYCANLPPTPPHSTTKPNLTTYQKLHRFDMRLHKHCAWCLNIISSFHSSCDAPNWLSLAASVNWVVPRLHHTNTLVIAYFLLTFFTHIYKMPHLVLLSFGVVVELTGGYSRGKVRARYEWRRSSAHDLPK